MKCRDQKGDKNHDYPGKKVKHMNKKISIESILNNETMFCGWPIDIPRPTIEEYQVAELRYKKTIHENDSSDYRSGLSFVMSTYSSFVWLPFFSY